MEEQGLYCGTAGAFFQDKESLVEHYKSEFHRWGAHGKSPVCLHDVPDCPG